MSTNEHETNAQSNGDAHSVRVETATNERRWKAARRGIGLASYWVRGNSRLLTRIVAGVFAVAVSWATFRWLQVAVDRLSPCADLVPQPLSCDAPAAALRGFQLGLATLGALVGVAAAVLALGFVVFGAEPRREPRLLRRLVIGFLFIMIGWLALIALSGGPTITLESGSV